jgi:hypothetical protein
LEDVLHDTYGLLVFQEQAIKISQKVAGFSEEEADTVRKSIGKKDVELMSKTEESFVKGCINTHGMSEEDAQSIFESIRKSQRYSFNLCLTPDTIIETRNSLKSIEEVSIGDKIKIPISLSTSTYSKVINKYNNGLQEVYQITLESGKQIKCTLDHYFLCKDWVKRPLWQIIEQNLQILCEDD